VSRTLPENLGFLLMSAYAVAAYGYLHAPMDIDIWVMPSTNNARAWPRIGNGAACMADYGKMANTRAGKPLPFFGLGNVTTASAPSSGTRSR